MYIPTFLIQYEMHKSIMMVIFQNISQMSREQQYFKYLYIFSLPWTLVQNTKLKGYLIQLLSASIQ